MEISTNSRERSASASEFLLKQAKRLDTIPIASVRYFYGKKDQTSAHDANAICESALHILSNCVTASFVLDNQRWKSSEHYYQAHKFIDTDPEYAKVIAATNSSVAVAKLGRDAKHPIDPNWETKKEDVMLRALRAKFQQNDDARKILLSTGYDALHEDAGLKDLYWGVGTPTKPGQDRLGQLLIHVRAELEAGCNPGVSN